MRKTLIKSEQEYRNHVFRIINADKIDVWEGFDKERLEKAFDLIDRSYERTDKMTDEEASLIAYYLDCRENPTYLEKTELKGSVSGISNNSLEEAFGVFCAHEFYDYDEDGNEVDEEGNIIPDDSSCPEALVFEDWVKEMTYPFIIVSWMDSGFDRAGDFSFCAVDFVELKEFNQ